MKGRLLTAGIGAAVLALANVIANAPAAHAAHSAHCGPVANSYWTFGSNVISSSVKACDTGYGNYFDPGGQASANSTNNSLFGACYVYEDVWFSGVYYGSKRIGNCVIGGNTTLAYGVDRPCEAGSDWATYNVYTQFIYNGREFTSNPAGLNLFAC